MTAAQPSKVLVVRVGRVGDVVMITPALNLLLEGLPGAEIHMLTSGDGLRVLKDYHPRLTRSHLYHRRFPANLLLARRVPEVLQREGYRRIYVLETNRHYHELVSGAAPEIYALEERTGSVHYSEHCMNLVEPTLPQAVPRRWLTLPVTDAGRVSAEALLADHGVEAGEWLVGLHPTCSGSTAAFFEKRDVRRNKEWPVASCAETARLLHEYGQERGIPVRPVVDLLPEERSIVRELTEKSDGAVTVLSGPPDFERYKAVLERMDLLVTPDTGPMHVAAAVGTTLVALFCGWSPEDCGPFVPEERFAVVRAEDSGDPELGLASIPPQTIFEACRPFLPGGDRNG
jgi:ADP-heptose:LPS heptosyltransferase